MIKTLNWQSNLSKVINEERFKPFEWGVNDCTLFCAMCIDAQFDSNVYKDSLKKLPYKSEKEALKLIKSKKGLHNIFAMFLKDGDLKNPIRGDVCIVKTSAGDTGALFYNNTFVIKTPEGLAFIKAENLELIKIYSGVK